MKSSLATRDRAWFDHHLFERMYESPGVAVPPPLPSFAWRVGGQPSPPPGPSGQPVGLLVRCDGGARHEISIDSDWSVMVPHDLAAERVLVALGGRTPCVDLVDRVVPLARVWLELHLRIAIPHFASWYQRPSMVGPCCRPLIGRTVSFTPSPFRDLAAHARSATHLATVADVDYRALIAVTDRLAMAYGFDNECLLPVDSAASAAACVDPPEALAHLWLIGLSPRAVMAIHSARSRLGRPLPSREFEDLVRRGPEALGDDLPVTDSRQRAFAALGTVGDSDRPSLVSNDSAWLATGLPWHLIAALMQAEYSPPEVVALSDGRGISLVAAGRVFVRWAKADCHPEVEELLSLARVGLGDSDLHISTAIVERLGRMLNADGIGLTPTQRGLLIVAAGSVPEARAWARVGITDPIEIAERIGDGIRPELTEARSTQLA